MSARYGWFRDRLAASVENQVSCLFFAHESGGRTTRTADPASRVIHQHALQKVNAALVQCWDCFRKRHSFPLWERRFIVWQKLDAGPILLCRGSERAGRRAKRRDGSQFACPVDPTLQSKTHRKMRKISSISESPGNRGPRIAISAKMQPTLHISIAVE